MDCRRLADPEQQMLQQLPQAAGMGVQVSCLASASTGPTQH